jgi:hypothetical protein
MKQRDESVLFSDLVSSSSVSLSFRVVEQIERLRVVPVDRRTDRSIADSTARSVIAVALCKEFY